MASGSKGDIQGLRQVSSLCLEAPLTPPASPLFRCANWIMKPEESHLEKEEFLAISDEKSINFKYIKRTHEDINNNKHSGKNCCGG